MIERLGGVALRHLLGLLIVLVLSSCSNIGVGSQLPTPVPVTAIGLEDAKRIALETGSHGVVEIAPISVTPRVVQIELITLGEAFERTNASVPRGDDPQALVWYIRLEGLWRDAFPRLPTDPTPIPFPRLAVMIDSQTGFVYSVGGSK